MNLHTRRYTARTCNASAVASRNLKQDRSCILIYCGKATPRWKGRGPIRECLLRFRLLTYHGVESQILSKARRLALTVPANLFARAQHPTKRGNSCSPGGIATLLSSGVFVTCPTTENVHFAMLQDSNKCVPCNLWLFQLHLFIDPIPEVQVSLPIWTKRQCIAHTRGYKGHVPEETEARCERQICSKWKGSHGATHIRKDVRIGATKGVPV